ncbi:glycosyltransferase [Mannheimia haemolytica]|nr:glycosyltransferase [Mannheimia haemolytica]MDW1149256.1 glycosyltransferase [Mannheimia haemolytica]MDW1159608.1 glycosyltransferase [Mannheimia haemolytica]
MNFTPTALIPHYNHSTTIGKVVAELLALDLPVLVVDDGSSIEHQAVLKTLESDKVRLVFRENLGQIRPLVFAVNRFMAKMRQKHGSTGGKSPTFG